MSAGASAIADFDLLGDLPENTTLLEASAGTGKTFTIAGLVTRYIAEGLARLDELLVVTFGRAATQELRDRVRERMVSARDGLLDPLAARAGDDALLAHLAHGEADEVAARRHRLVQALGDFDAATVATTHEFCRQVLTGLGTAGDVDATAVLVENLDDLTVEVVQDLYLRMWSRPNAGDPPLSYDKALELAHAVVRDAQAVLVPEDSPPDGVPDIRRRFALKVREEVERRKRERYLLSFDDLLTRLRDTLADPRSGPAAKQRLRSRYRVVLVDEFQDTDPVQWQILEQAFHGHTTLILIGDPKQAIYAFRGADVHAYLAAAEVADHRATLATNWRSDPDLLRGLDAVFRGAALGDPRIVVLPVSAGHPGRCLAPSATGNSAAPVALRVVGGPPESVSRARELVTADAVHEVIELLESGRTLTPRDGSAARPVLPGDIAVVVRSSKQLDLVHTALLAAGVPSVQRTTSSVFRTQAGADWLILLEALEQPHRAGRVRRLAITSFVGWDAAGLETNDLDELGLRLRRWQQLFAERGIAALLEAVSRDEALTARLLGQQDGERLLTDLRHVGEALHAAATTNHLGLTATLEWLRRRVDEADRDNTVERSRRLDSDADAVQIVTVHASKGLEFPIVLVPFGWDRFVFETEIPLFHDAQGRRVRNVGGKAPGFFDDCRKHNAEEFGEDLRLVYVALTRAQAQVIAWWAASTKNTDYGPLHRLLFADDPARDVPDRVAVPRSGEQALIDLGARAGDGCLSITAAQPRAPRTWAGAATTGGTLSAATWRRTVDTTWRRTSYSALTKGAHDAASTAVGSEPEATGKTDEPEVGDALATSGIGARQDGDPTAGPAARGTRGADPQPTTADAALRETSSPMASLVGGAAFGTLVHAVLEHADPTAGELAAELLGHTRAMIARLGQVGTAGAAEIAEALVPALRTPLGPLAGGRALSEIAPTDRLTELDFELPLRGGDRPNGATRLRELAPLLRRHLPQDDPMRAYADQLEDPLVGEEVLRGYLGGSIDAVLRVDGRYLVADYKTNRLGNIETPLTAWDYRQASMADAMLHAHYPLQALLYDVALHRYLRWRLPDYDPDTHLGGVLYLFLRGMCGPGVVGAGGSIPGVFAWRPPAALVLATSDVVDRGLAAGERPGADVRSS